MNKICVIGLGRFGMFLAERLAADGLEVLAIDSKQELVESIKDKVALAVRADARDEEVLSSLGVDTMDLVIVAIGDDFEAAELSLMACRVLGVPRIYARAHDHVKRRILQALGADQVIMPEEETALRLAQRLSMPALTESIELDRDHSMVQMPAPTKAVGHSMTELKLREKYSLNLVAIKSRPTQTMIMTKQDLESGSKNPMEQGEEIRIPTGVTVIHSGDTLILVGKDKNIDRFIRDHE